MCYFLMHTWLKFWFTVIRLGELKFKIFFSGSIMSVLGQASKSSSKLVPKLTLLNYLIFIDSSSSIWIITSCETGTISLVINIHQWWNALNFDVIVKHRSNLNKNWFFSIFNLIELASGAQYYWVAINSASLEELVLIKDLICKYY